jgi:hypothetical protein
MACRAVQTASNRDVEVIILPKVLISGEGAHIIKVSFFGDVEHLFPCRRGDRMRLAMSAIGTKRTSPNALHMSAFGGRADMAFCTANVRF